MRAELRRHRVELRDIRTERRAHGREVDGLFLMDVGHKGVKVVAAIRPAASRRE